MPLVTRRGAQVGIDYRPLPQDDPKVRRPDITKARELLGWEPRASRADGLRRAFEFFWGKVGR